MGKKSTSIDVEGVVLALLPSGKYKVEVVYKNIKKKFVCTLSGRVRMNHIRVIPGDKVQLTIPPRETDIGVIKYRFK